MTLAQEEERRRISRELHDDLGPSLAATINRVRACQQMLYTAPDVAQRELQEITTDLKGHIRDIRNLIYGLRPLAVDQMGLLGAVQQQSEQFTKQTGIEAVSEMPADVALDPLIEVTAFRVIQECLSNIQKHAGATSVHVKLKSVGDHLELMIEDNGRGFDHDEVVASAVGQGVGLLGMRERAEIVGGRLSVRSSPGKGCRVTLYVPLKEPNVGAHPSPAR